MAGDITDPVVLQLIAALNAGDRAAFLGVLTPDATMSDDGTDRDLTEWVDREIFDSNGHLDVESATDDGRSIVANYRNDTWGAMRTVWHFTVEGDRISRIDTGQAAG
jgi:hypothetical protein